MTLWFKTSEFESLGWLLERVSFSRFRSLGLYPRSGPLHIYLEVFSCRHTAVSYPALLFFVELHNSKPNTISLWSTTSPSNMRQRNEDSYPLAAPGNPTPLSLGPGNTSQDLQTWLLNQSLLLLTRYCVALSYPVLFPHCFH